MTYTATPSQIGYLNSLIRGRFTTVGDAAYAFGIESGSLNKRDASALIDWLKNGTDSAATMPTVHPHQALVDQMISDAKRARGEI